MQKKLRIDYNYEIINHFKYKNKFNLIVSYQLLIALKKDIYVNP